MPYEQLFNKIFDKSYNDSDAPVFLKNVTEQYPYFGLAHFYHLKYSSANDSSYDKTAAKSALFFTSNFYLSTQLNEVNTILNNLPDTVKISDTLEPEKKDVEEITSHQNDELLFEPLHSSDYFASQGIKLSEDALNADKLGKQLKSFTAWLKTMKKVHPDKLPAVNLVTESAVQTQAEKSNLEEEIVTEPMAEAYILQNKNVKAIDIYNKLSLLNPAKSAYFAAKIDSLKK